LYSEGKVIVKILKAALLIFMIIAVSACGSAERKKNKAEARVLRKPRKIKRNWMHARDL
jgi:hypothetical protein